MLIGDNKPTAERIGAEVGVTDVQAELLPDQKVAAMTDLQTTIAVAMIGDGVNDAPALATGSVEVAMGAAGADVAIEAADVTLTSDELEQLPVAIRLARRTMVIIREHIAASLVIRALFLALTFVGLTNLWLAVFANTGMAVLAIFNSLHLLGGSGGPWPWPGHRGRSRSHPRAPTDRARPRHRLRAGRSKRQSRTRHPKLPGTMVQGVTT